MTDATVSSAIGIQPNQVMEVLRRHMLVDGVPMVLDLDRSEGSWLVDSDNGKKYLDFFSFFASAPLGMNPPDFKDEAIQRRLEKAAHNNPSNSDFYTVEMADFVDTLSRLARPANMQHLFFIAGGAPAVENGLKVAFDWKVRKNFHRGYRHPRGTQVAHLEEAFHGRLGYTLSLTNTADPRKTQFYPVFDWPRALNPKIRFPLEGKNLADVEAAEKISIAQLERAFTQRTDAIAAIIVEPIQGEGGDNHFRPEFFRELRRLADENEALLIFDEIQTGVGMTGKMWAHEHFGVNPDILVFGKKMQVCGIWVSDRVDEVPNNVFVESGRINSTWGGNLVDMVRGAEYLRIIERDKLVEGARKRGAQLLAGVQSLVHEFPQWLGNARGRGLMVAFDVATPEHRQKILDECLQRELIIVATGTHGIRFRPALNVRPEDIDEGLNRMSEAIRASVAMS